MPAGPLPLGFVYFAVIKFAGYTAAGSLLRRRYQQTSPKPVVFGAARTALGIVVGISFSMLLSGVNVTHSDHSFYMLLAPVRLGEWLFMIWFFFGRARPQPARLIRYSILGGLWSYLLDVPAVAAVFYIPGGAWIC